LLTTVCSCGRCTTDRLTGLSWQLTENMVDAYDVTRSCVSDVKYSNQTVR